MELYLNVFIGALCFVTTCITALLLWAVRNTRNELGLNATKRSQRGLVVTVIAAIAMLLGALSLFALGFWATGSAHTDFIAYVFLNDLVFGVVAVLGLDPSRQIVHQREKAAKEREAQSS